MKLVLPCVIALTIVMASPAEAQWCAGAPPFFERPLQAGFAAALTDGARGVGGTVAAGGETIFGGGGVSVFRYTDLDARATEITLFAGAELQVDDSGVIFLCPVGQLGFGFGPDIGPIDVSTFTIQGGGNLGVIASDRRGLTVVPTFGLFAVRTRVSTDVGGDEDSVSDGSGLANVGVGFVFNRNVAIIPALSIPFSAGSSDPIFSVRFVFNFGR